MTDTDVRGNPAQAASTETFGHVLCSARNQTFASVAGARVKNWCVSTAPADRSKLWMGRCRTAASARPIRVAQPCHFRRSPEILGSTSPATKLRFTSSATTLATMSYPPGSYPRIRSWLVPALVPPSQDRFHTAGAAPASANNPLSYAIVKVVTPDSWDGVRCPHLQLDQEYRNHRRTDRGLS